MGLSNFVFESSSTNARAMGATELLVPEDGAVTAQMSEPGLHLSDLLWGGVRQIKVPLFRGQNFRHRNPKLKDRCP